MTAEELREIMYRHPFQPFRLMVKDGRTFDIRYPYSNIVGDAIAAIGIPEANDPDPKSCDYQVFVPVKWITGVEPLPPSSTSADS